MVKRKQSKQAAPAVPTPKAQGTTKKRTPQSAFDPAAGKDVYEPEKVIAKRIVKHAALLVDRALGAAHATALSRARLHQCLDGVG